MNRFLLLLLLAFSAHFSSAQNFKGQWKGHFIDKSSSPTGWSGVKYEYVLELEVQSNKVSGYSYTYFTDAGKKYYTICKITGTINRKSKFLEVKETERTKTNVPYNIRNCFQVHRVTYFKNADGEILEGNWVPVPDQTGDCGFGATRLERRTLKTSYFGYREPSKKITPKSAVPPTPPVAKAVPKKPIPKTHKPAISAPDNSGKDLISQNEKEELLEKSPEMRPPADFKKRNLNVLKTINVISETVRVDLYDNGEIDGDSISLIYNGKLLVSNKKLSDKALTFHLEIEKDRDVNELVMYAENLGSIPPNTALMVVTDSGKRYEVRISSDLQKSGVINFKYNP